MSPRASEHDLRQRVVSAACGVAAVIDAITGGRTKATSLAAPLAKLHTEVAALRRYTAQPRSVQRPSITVHAAKRYAERYPAPESSPPESMRDRMHRLWPDGEPAGSGPDGARHWRLPDGAVCVVKNGRVVTVLPPILATTIGAAVEAKAGGGA